MTREEFMQKYQDWMYGFAVAAFAEEHGSTGDFSKKGRVMIQRMNAARSKLQEMYADLCPPAPAPPLVPPANTKANGPPQPATRK